MATQADRLKLARLIALAVPLALLGGAYGSQIWGGLYPCEMCWWQRYGHFAALPLAALAFALPKSRLLLVLAGLGIASSSLIGAFHAGVEYGWWQGLTACTTGVKFGGGDALAAIMAAPLVRCDVVQWKLLGISLAGYNFLISGAAAVAILALVAKGKRA